MHKPQENISVANADTSKELKKKLADFKAKVTKGRLVQFWDNSADLATEVAVSVSRAKNGPRAIGWVRADSVPDLNAVEELKILRKQNEELKEAVKDKSLTLTVKIAELDEIFSLEGTYTSVSVRDRNYHAWQASMSWREIFASFCVDLLSDPRESSARDRIAAAAVISAGYSSEQLRGYYKFVNDECFGKIKIQFMALGIIKNTKMALSEANWELTEKGEALMYETKVTKSSK